MKKLILILLVIATSVTAGEIPTDPDIDPSKVPTEPTQCHFGYEGCDQGVGNCETNCDHELDHNLANCADVPSWGRAVCYSEANKVYKACLAGCR